MRKNNNARPKWPRITMNINAKNNGRIAKRRGGPGGRPRVPVAGAHNGRPYGRRAAPGTSNKRPARGAGRAQIASFNFPNSLDRVLLSRNQP